MAGRHVSPFLVGRAAEVEALTRALDRAVARDPVHQLVGGEAGVGKTRLVAELATIAGERGFRLLGGGCADIGDGGVPFGPIVEAFRTLVRDLDAGEIERIVGPGRADLARLVPALGPAAHDTGAAAASLQPRLLEGILGVLLRIAEAEPVLFVIEDLHWADPATRDTVAFLARQLRNTRVLLLTTFRTDDLHRRHPLLPWLAEMERSGRAARVDIARLEMAETGRLLAAILGSDQPATLVDPIHRRSDGNPFFIEELIGAGGAGSGLALPPTLRDVLLARLVALPERAQIVVRAIAVAGRRVEHDALARVAGLSDTDLLEGLRAAVGSHVLVTGSEATEHGADYAFRHALLQEVAYDDLLPGERQRLHRAFAELLAEGVGHIEGVPDGFTGAPAAGRWAELAWHWSAARDDRRAFEATIRAGDAAARTFAFADSRRHDERALAMWATIEDAASLAGIDRVALLDRAAVAALLSGDSHRTVALRREAVSALRPAGDPERLGVALEGLGRALWFDGDVTGAVTAHEEAIALSPAEPTPTFARVLAGYAQILMLLDRWPEAETHAVRAVAMARATGALQAEGHALCSLGLILAALARPAESEAALQAAIRIALDIENADDLGRGYTNLTAARRYSGDPVGSLAATYEGMRVVDPFGLKGTYGAFIRENGIVAAFELGRWAEADALADDSIEMPRPGRQTVRYRLVHWLPLLVARGDEQAAPRLDDLRELVEGLEVESQFHGPFRIHVAEHALWQGDPAAALRSIRTGIGELRAIRALWHEMRLFRVGMRAAADLAAIARARRDDAGERSALAAGDELLAGIAPIVELARAEQGGLALDETETEAATIDAERRRLQRAPSADAWSTVADRWDARDNPYLAAYARWRLAEAHLGAGDRAAAGVALAAAHAAATVLAAAPLLAEVTGLATRARLPVGAGPTDGPAAPSVAVPADPFGLTRRETEVLGLVVRGRTNRQIADELFISENTAGVHVSNILGKLGAATRTEAAGIAARLGLAPATPDPR